MYVHQKTELFSKCIAIFFKPSLKWRGLRRPLLLDGLRILHVMVGTTSYYDGLVFDYLPLTDDLNAFSVVCISPFLATTPVKGWQRIKIWTFYGYAASSGHKILTITSS